MGFYVSASGAIQGHHGPLLLFVTTMHILLYNSKMNLHIKWIQVCTGPKKVTTIIMAKYHQYLGKVFAYFYCGVIPDCR